jgi:ferredoxin
VNAGIPTCKHIARLEHPPLTWQLFPCSKRACQARCFAVRTHWLTRPSGRCRVGTESTPAVNPASVRPPSPNGSRLASSTTCAVRWGIAPYAGSQLRSSSSKKWSTPASSWDERSQRRTLPTRMAWVRSLQPLVYQVAGCRSCRLCSKVCSRGAFLLGQSTADAVAALLPLTVPVLGDLTNTRLPRYGSPRPRLLLLLLSQFMLDSMRAQECRGRWPLLSPTNMRQIPGNRLI